MVFNFRIVKSSKNAKVAFEDEEWKEALLKKLRGLIEKDAIEFVSQDEKPDDAILFHYLWGFQ